MRLDEAVDAVEIVDARRIFDVGRLRILMALAEAHQRLMRPGIVVIDRDLDDARLDDGLGLRRPRFSSAFSSASMSAGLITSGSNLIWNEALAGQISVTPLILRVAHRVGDRQALEEGLERHLLVASRRRCARRRHRNIGSSCERHLPHELNLRCVGFEPGSSQRVWNFACLHLGHRRPAADAAASSS